MKHVLSAVVVLCCTSAARADLPTACAESFPARLADAQRALRAYEAYQRQYDAAQPAVLWFEANCHFLSELERAARREDDLNAFVCRTKKGRPKSLTAELVAEFQTHAPFTSFLADEFHGPDHQCLEEDRAQRVGLLLRDDASPIERLELMCFGDASERCERARAAIAAARSNAAR